MIPLYDPSTDGTGTYCCSQCLYWYNTKEEKNACMQRHGFETIEIHPIIPWWSTDFDEADIAAVADAIRGRHISQGAITRRFEEALAETLGVSYVVCTSSGTTALTMALMAAGIGQGQGDTVIVPDRTWIATAHAVMMTGAEIKLVDTNERGLLPKVLVGYDDGHGTYAMPVNLNGRLAEMPADPMASWGCPPLAIEDSCQAFPMPPRGLAACYSMSTAKLVPTGQGGFVATRDEGFYRECLALRTHDVADAMVPQVLQWRRFGYNFRYTDLQASIGLVQLSRLRDRMQRLEEIDALYRAGLPNYLRMVPRETGDTVPLYAEVLYPDAERLRAHLLADGIQARPHYPSLHTAPYLKPPNRTGYFDYQFPHANSFSLGLTLPSGPAQTDENIKRTLESLHRYSERG